MFKIILNFLILLFLNSCSNSNKQIVKEFYENINEGKISESKALTDNDFIVQYRWENNKLNKDDYFSRILNGLTIKPKIEITKISDNGNAVMITNKTSSLFNKYLSIPEYEYKTKVFFKNKLIHKIEIDTLKGFRKNSNEIRKKWSKFYDWLQIEQPKIKFEELSKEQSELLIYLEKYSEQKK